MHGGLRWPTPPQSTTFLQSGNHDRFLDCLTSVLSCYRCVRVQSGRSPRCRKWVWTNRREARLETKVEEAKKRRQGRITESWCYREKKERTPRKRENDQVERKRNERQKKEIHGNPGTCSPLSGNPPSWVWFLRLIDKMIDSVDSESINRSIHFTFPGRLTRSPGHELRRNRHKNFKFFLALSDLEKKNDLFLYSYLLTCACTCPPLPPPTPEYYYHHQYSFNEELRYLM